MLVLHANWTNGALHLWGESTERFGDPASVTSELASADAHDHHHDHEVGDNVRVLQKAGSDSRDAVGASVSIIERAPRPAAPAPAPTSSPTSSTTPGIVDEPEHRFATSADDLVRVLEQELRMRPREVEVDDADEDDAVNGSAFAVASAPLRLRLPARDDVPLPSDRFAAINELDSLPADGALQTFSVPAVRVRKEYALEVLLTISGVRSREIVCGHDTRFWCAAAQWLMELLLDHRFVPTIFRVRSGELRAAWQPWLHDEAARERLLALLRAMPPSSRAVMNSSEESSQPWPILREALRELTDGAVRRFLIEEVFADALEGKRAAPDDPHVMWLGGLLGHEESLGDAESREPYLLPNVARWLGRLHRPAEEGAFRLALEVQEPELPGELTGANAIRHAVERARWVVTIHLQSKRKPQCMLEAERAWQQPAPMLYEGETLADPQEFLLRELRRAGELCPMLEPMLAGEAPQSLELPTEAAHTLLSEYRPLLEESGINVIAPAWFDDAAQRLGVRLHLRPAGDVDEAREGSDGSVTAIEGGLGLDALVRFDWQASLGDELLTREQFEQIAAQASPMVPLGGRWIELRRAEVEAVQRLLAENEGEAMPLREAMRKTFARGRRDDDPIIHGIEAEGWVDRVLSASVDSEQMPQLEQPERFKGSLRPYQKVGISWLSFLDRFGFGACLADDMGLGKTIQLIALLLHERAQHERALEAAGGAEPQNERLRPTLLVVPTSLLANWEREIERFGPELQTLIHHGPERAGAADFAGVAMKYDVIITTYGLVTRDRELLEPVHWRRVVLDEAQYIKNPPTKQTAAIRALRTDRRIALTGTPLENRLTELWSIMEFCNPGYLGTAADFRRRFAVPIERHRDVREAERLRRLVQPFVLRRLKTDPKVINDLPPLVETKEYAPLTPEQASLYEDVVSGMLREVDRREGIDRRGLVLATLTRLKQICNHPSQFLKEKGEAATGARNASGKGSGAAAPDRSGKVKRLMSMLEDLVDAGDQALVFTQFRQMGHLLVAMIEHRLDREVLFLHGGTPMKKRQQLIDRFQSRQDSPIFVLSLKAGGLGLNLTAANHVFHFDRWWNPAVEKQATDRAFRIGQNRTVHVHKFVCLGTLEERIDRMLEQKVELAENILGSGEQWLTELSTAELRDLLLLRDTAMEEGG